MDGKFIDHLPDSPQDKRWIVLCPPEGYSDQEKLITSGTQDYLDLHLRLEGTESQAVVRARVSMGQLVADLKRPGLFRMFALGGEFLDFDYRPTNRYVELSGYVELSVSNPDTVAGEVTMTTPEAPPHPLTA